MTAANISGHQVGGRKRHRFTLDQLFERWWARVKPSRRFCEEEGLSDLHENIIKDFAQIAFYRGYEVRRRRNG